VGLQALDKTFVPTYKTTRRHIPDDITVKSPVISDRLCISSI